MKKDHVSKRKQRIQKRSSSSREKSDDHVFQVRTLLRILFYICFFAFIFSVLYSLFFSPFLKVGEYEIVGSERVSEQRVRSLISDELSGSNSFGISNTNLLLMSIEDLERKILSSIVELESVEIERVFPSMLHVQLKEYDTIMIVCGRVLTTELESGQDSQRTRDVCMSVDEEGLRGQEEELSSERLLANPTLIVEVDGLLPLSVGDAVFTPEVRTRLFYIVEEMPYRLSLRAVGTPKIASLGSTHVEIATDEDWVLLIDLMHEPRVSLRVLEAFFEQTRELDIRSTVEEIDIRLLDKIFYKKKEQEDSIELSEEIVSEDNADSGLSDEEVDE